MYFWIKIISPLKRISAKISFIILIIVLLYACDSTKRVPNGENLLVHTELIVDGKTVIPRGLFKERDLIPINKPFETGETTK